jgi:endo-1,4-beta-D-glucanase Y
MLFFEARFSEGFPELFQNFSRTFPEENLQKLRDRLENSFVPEKKRSRLENSFVPQKKRSRLENSFVPFFSGTSGRDTRLEKFDFTFSF